MALAANPLVPHIGMADPHVHVYNNSFYLYATSDFSVNNTGFKNEWWWVWQSDDLVVWTVASIVYPNATAAQPKEYDTCWATDAAQRNGKSYFYISMGPEEIGVLESDGPGGPWRDTLGRALINASLGKALNTEARDPAVFADDDGEHYLIFGTMRYFIARLGPDMQSLAEDPMFITVLNATSQNGVGVVSPVTLSHKFTPHPPPHSTSIAQVHQLPLHTLRHQLDDKPFMHKRGGLYYLSFGCFYGTSTSVYGPFTYVGTWIDPQLIAPDFRTNVTDGPWYKWQDYNDRHGSFFSAGGQDMWSSNDRSHSGESRSL